MFHGLGAGDSIFVVDYQHLGQEIEGIRGDQRLVSGGDELSPRPLGPELLVHDLHHLPIRPDLVLLHIFLDLLTPHLLQDHAHLVRVAVAPEHHRLLEDLHQHIHTNPASTHPSDQISSEYP